MDADRMKRNLCAFCAVPSVSHTPGERLFAPVLRSALEEIPYFQRHPEDISVLPVSAREEDGAMVFALMRAPGQVKKTILLLSHFDVVGVDEYGALRELAFSPLAYTQALREGRFSLDADAQRDLESGNYLFGRGVCDMKWGIALDVELMHEFDAHPQEMKANLLLVSVPDEERNSVGMLGAVEALGAYARERDLELTACMVGEPNITPERDDSVRAMHIGAAGKVMPSFYCFGRVTHVGEPFAGLNAASLAAEITRRMELSSEWVDAGEGFFTPAPMCLKMADLKEAYSVQSPSAAYCYFNVITASSTPEEIMERMERVAREAFEAVNEERAGKHAACEKKLGKHIALTRFAPKVIRYEELYRACVQAHGEAFEREIAAFIQANRELDVRELSVRTVARVHDFYPEREPVVVLFLCPPFYPHTGLADPDGLVRRACTQMIAYGAQKGETLKVDECFMGLTDMSYLSLRMNVDTSALSACYPVWGTAYSLPLEQMRALDIPFVNFGPLGRDPHRASERVDLAYSFGKAPQLALQLTRLLMA